MDLEARYPEPELMDDPDQARAYSDADFSGPHQAFADELVRRFPDLAHRTARIVDLGCGPADVTVRVARACPVSTVVGIDAGATMVALARQRVRAAGLASRVTLEQVHLPDDDLKRWPADAVVSNSLLHHLADPAVLWRSVHQMARPGAVVFVMDLVRPADVRSAEALVDRYARDEPEVLRADFRNSLLAAYRVSEVEEQLRRSPLPLRVELLGDRHWLAWGRYPSA